MHLIPFLTKIANYLDDKNQTELATQIDELTEKVAQSYPEAQKQKQDTIRFMQHMMGMPVNGHWDPVTNAKFIDYMNKNFPIAMKDNKFVGVPVDDKGHRAGNKLQDAYELMKQNEGQKQELVADQEKAKADEALIGRYHSKYFKITPELSSMLAQLDKARGQGWGQRMLDTFDRHPDQTEQDLKETILQYDPSS